MNKIIVKRNNTRTINFLIINKKTKKVFDLTDYAAKMTVRKDSVTGMILFQIDGTISTPTNGIILFELSSANTATIGNHCYDVQITSTTKVYTAVGPDILEVLDTPNHND